MVGANAASIYLSRQFSAAIKEDIRRQSEAGSSSTVSVITAKLGNGASREPEHSKAPPKSLERRFLPKNRSAICAKRDAQRNGAGEMCVNIRNAWRIGEGDARDCEWFDLLNIFSSVMQQVQTLFEKSSQGLPRSLKANCAPSRLDLTLSSPLRLEDKMI